jgi:hypothetical protein
MRVGRSLICVFGFVCAGSIRDAVAQSSTQGTSVVLMPGARVRVTTSAIGRVVGTLVDAADDSVRVEVSGGSTLTVSKANLGLLELSTGVRRHGWRGAGIGALVGVGIGGAVGLATYRRTDCQPDPLKQLLCDLVDRTSREVTVMADAAMIGTAGAIVGALIGQVGRESWVRVPMRRDARVGLVRGLGLGVRIGM